MDIKSLTPQTQRFLTRFDYNQDDKLSARELNLLAQLPAAPGIDQKDLLKIQAELKQAKGPETIIVSLVDERTVPPGYTPARPLFSEAPESQKPAAKVRPSQSSASSPASTAASQAPKQAEKKKGPAAPADASPFSLKAVPKVQTKEPPLGGAGAPAQPEQELTGVDLQSQAQVGALKLQGTNSFNAAGQHTTTKLKASYQMAPALGLNLGLDTVEARPPQKTQPKNSPGKAKTPAPAPASPSSALPTELNLSGQMDMGKVKVNAKGRLNTESAQVDHLSTGVEMELIQGHALKAETRPVAGPKGQGVNWSSIELGTQHKLFEGLSLTTQFKPGESQKPHQYGAGFRYNVTEGLSLDGAATTRKDTRYEGVLDTARSLDYKLGFRYKMSF